MMSNLKRVRTLVVVLLAASLAFALVNCGSASTSPIPTVSINCGSSSCL
jgi:hypothetical protein